MQEPMTRKICIGKDKPEAQ